MVGQTTDWQNANEGKVGPIGEREAMKGSNVARVAQVRSGWLAKVGDVQPDCLAKASWPLVGSWQFFPKKIIFSFVFFAKALAAKKLPPKKPYSK